MPKRPIQHTPKHLLGDVYDTRHPAASQFAVGQPAAGVVADDVPDEQNPAGAPKASNAPTIDPPTPEAEAVTVRASADGGVVADDGDTTDRETASTSKTTSKRK